MGLFLTAFSFDGKKKKKKKERTTTTKGKLWENSERHFFFFFDCECEIWKHKELVIFMRRKKFRKFGISGQFGTLYFS